MKLTYDEKLQIVQSIEKSIEMYQEYARNEKDKDWVKFWNEKANEMFPLYNKLRKAWDIV